jgi:hypothetical protein
VATQIQFGSLHAYFFTIDSSDAFCQLRDVCGASRQVKEHVILQLIKSISEAMQALNQLDITAITASILHRFYLTFLVTQCDKQKLPSKSVTQMCVKNPELQLHKLRSWWTDSNWARLSSVHWYHSPDSINDQCLSQPEADPEVQYSNGWWVSEKLSSLKVRLCDGRNWHKMQQWLSSEILALMPTQGDYQIQNCKLVFSLTSFVNFLIQNRVERLSTPQFSLFLKILIEFCEDFLWKVSELISQHICKILYQKDLNWRYVFETLDEDDLK